MQVSTLFSRIIASREAGAPQGLASVCSAHPVVIRAAIGQAIEDGGPVLVEATANQVNQHGGYTGMQPGPFRSFVEGEARTLGLPPDRLLLGGDPTDATRSRSAAIRTCPST